MMNNSKAILLTINSVKETALFCSAAFVKKQSSRFGIPPFPSKAGNQKASFQDDEIFSTPSPFYQQQKQLPNSVLQQALS
jgi:hypothetical protein